MSTKHYFIAEDSASGIIQSVGYGRDLPPAPSGHVVIEGVCDMQRQRWNNSTMQLDPAPAISFTVTPVATAPGSISILTLGAAAQVTIFVSGVEHGFYPFLPSGAQTVNIEEPGTYTLRATAPGYLSTDAAVTVAPGGLGTVSLDPFPEYTIVSLTEKADQLEADLAAALLLPGSTPPLLDAKLGAVAEVAMGMLALTRRIGRGSRI